MRLTRTAYTCPVLMGVSAAIYRLSRHPARWKDCGGVWRLIRSIPGRSHGYEARCLFPRWAILIEWRFWASRPGLKLMAYIQRVTDGNPRPA